MLAIWSRARQNPGTCRCISCVSNATTVARRLGPTGLRGSWAFGTPTSTFVYTTVFAAGLAVDAKAKAARNKQWDEAFAHLKDELDRPLPRERAQKMEAASGGYYGMFLDDLPNDLDWDAVHRAVGMDLVDDEVLREQEAQSQAHGVTWDDLRFDSSLPGAQSLEWPANTGPDLVRYHLPPQSLWSPDTLRLTAMRRRHTWKKLAMQELSTGLLIHTLIIQANLPRFFRKAPTGFNATLSPRLFEIASLTETQAQEARQGFLDNIEKLHKTDVNSPADDIVKAKIHVDQPAIPRYTQDADGDFYGIRQQMNDGIKHLLDVTPRGNDRKEALTIAKICHNLLVSTASPDLHTFNILLSGFRRLRRPNLVDEIIAAFYVHKIRPNEISCCEILDHYIMSSRPDDFSRFVARMRGVGDALMLAAPNVNVNEASHNRLVRVNKDKLYQKVHPTPMVFGALIGGVLKFAGFDRALDVYYELKADGWGLDINGLVRLLRYCIRRANWDGGMYVWEEINSISMRSKSRDMARAYYHMLSLCSVTGNTVAFNQILREVARLGYDSRSIVNAAEKTTRGAQNRAEHLTPAWAADNVLIAVSDYVKMKPSDTETGATPDDDEMFTQHGPDSYDALEEDAFAQAERVDQEDPKEAWASWVEHEFGERPKDPEP